MFAICCLIFHLLDHFWKIVLLQLTGSEALGGCQHSLTLLLSQLTVKQFDNAGNPSCVIPFAILFGRTTCTLFIDCSIILLVFFKIKLVLVQIECCEDHDEPVAGKDNLVLFPMTSLILQLFEQLAAYLVVKVRVDLISQLYVVDVEG